MNKKKTIVLVISIILSCVLVCCLISYNIKISDSTINKEVKSLGVNVQDKSFIFNKMINSIDYFTEVKGNYEYSDNRIKYNEQVEYEIVLTPTIRSYEKISNNTNVVENTYSNGILKIKDLTSGKETSYTNISENKIEESKKNKESRIVKDKSGVKTYIYRPELEYLTKSRVSILPETVAMGFLEDFEKWDIKKQYKFAFRDTLVLGGKFAGSYAERKEASSFEVHIDLDTGIMLKYVTFNDEGDIVEKLETKSITIQ